MTRIVEPQMGRAPRAGDPARRVSLTKKLLRLTYGEVRRRLSGYGLARLRLVRAIEGLVRSALRSDFTEVLGHRMYVDPADRAELAINGIYEPLTTALVERETAPGQVVVDVGANVGYYTLLCARRVGASGQVFAFEPEPENFALLERNVHLNGYRNVRLFQKALSDRPGTARLYLDESNRGDCRLYDSGDGRRSVEVETVRLDDALAGSPGQVDLIKMDIQGAECAALRGMLGLLARSGRARLITEFWPFGLRASGVEPEAYLRLLVEQGFTLFNVDERAGQVLATSIPELLGRYPADFSSATNLFCVRA